jgi:hypothetical protein
MIARRNPDHAARAIRRDLTAVIVIGILLSGAGGYGLRYFQERVDQPAGAYVIVPADVATPAIDRPERTAACRCAERRQP